MPVGFGKTAVKSKGRLLSVMAHVKHSIIEVKAETDCLAHALIIAIARLTNDPNYKAYRQGRKIHPVVQHLLQSTGITLDNGGGFLNSSDSKTNLQKTRLSCTGDGIVRI